MNELGVQVELKQTGTLIAGGGLVAGVLNLASAVWPAQVDSDRASYPLTAGTHVVFQIGFALAETVVTIGLIAMLLKSPRISAQPVRVAAWALPLAFVLFVVADLVEATLAHSSYDHAEAVLGPLFGPASLVYATAAIVAGRALWRAKLWGNGSWTLAVSGVILLALVLPTQFGAPRAATDLALAIWDLSIAAVGIAAARAAIATHNATQPVA